MLFGLPDPNSRIQIIHQFLLASSQWKLTEIQELGVVTNGFTGDDIRIACKEASMKMIRNAIDLAKLCNYITYTSKFYLTKLYTFVANSEPKHFIKDVQFSDLLEAIKRIKPIAKELIQRHEEWNKKYGH